MTLQTTLPTSFNMCELKGVIDIFGN